MDSDATQTARPTAGSSDGQSANRQALRWADRKPLSRLMGGSQTAGRPDGRIANRWAAGWVKRKLVHPLMGGTQTAGLPDGRNANRGTCTRVERKPMSLAQTHRPKHKPQPAANRSANRRRQGANASANFEPRFCSLRTRFEAVCAHAWTGVAGFETAAEPMITN